MLIGYEPKLGLTADGAVNTARVRNTDKCGCCCRLAQVGPAAGAGRPY